MGFALSTRDQHLYESLSLWTGEELAARRDAVSLADDELGHLLAELAR
jgi:hypothetical protein